MAEFDDSGKLRAGDIGSGHGEHGTEVHSSRKFTHKGHDVDIRASYRVVVDGAERQLHFSVGADGKVTTHLRPYFTYDSLVAMVKDVIDHFPGAFDEDAQAPGSHGGHGDA